jgi:hypothetical protein
MIQIKAIPSILPLLTQQKSLHIHLKPLFPSLASFSSRFNSTLTTYLQSLKPQPHFQIPLAKSTVHRNYLNTVKLKLSTNHMVLHFSASTR